MFCINVGIHELIKEFACSLGNPFFYEFLDELAAFFVPELRALEKREPAMPLRNRSKSFLFDRISNFEGMRIEGRSYGKSGSSLNSSALG